MYSKDDFDLIKDKLNDIEKKAKKYYQDNFEEPTIEQKLLLIIEHLEELIREKGNHGIIIARKHISWTCKDFKGATVLRNKLLKAVDIDEVKDLINKRIDSLNYEEKILSC